MEAVAVSISEAQMTLLKKVNLNRKDAADAADQQDYG
jgi:hypothetical protein